MSMAAGGASGRGSGTDRRMLQRRTHGGLLIAPWRLRLNQTGYCEQNPEREAPEPTTRYCLAGHSCPCDPVLSQSLVETQVPVRMSAARDETPPPVCSRSKTLDGRGDEGPNWFALGTARLGLGGSSLTVMFRLCTSRGALRRWPSAPDGAGGTDFRAAVRLVYTDANKLYTLD